MGSERSEWLGGNTLPLDPGAPDALDPKRDEESVSAEEPVGAEAERIDWVTALARAQDEEEARRDRLRSRRFLPSEEELLREAEEGLAKAHPPPPASEQVSVRLQPAQWKRLLIVAEMSGLRPTTMARLLINRGARAIIDEELRWRAQFDDPD